MRRILIFAIVAGVLCGCSSSGNSIIDEPELGDSLSVVDTVFVDSIISLDTAPKDFKGEVFKYPHLNREYWATLQSFEEMCEAASIPEDVLKRLTTEGLSQSCMYWPLYGNHFAYPTLSLSIYDGINISIEHCNALLELAKREQGGLALLKLYKYFTLGKQYIGWDEMDYPIDQRNNVIFKAYLELLLTTDYYITKLDKDLLVELGWAIERILLQCMDEEGNISWYGEAQYSYALWQKVLLCYNNYEQILTNGEIRTLTRNIMYLGMPGEGFDETQSTLPLIGEKKKIVLGIE